MEKIRILYEKYKYQLLIVAVMAVTAFAWVTVEANPPGTTGFIVKKHYHLPPYFMHEGNLYRFFNPNGQETIGEVVHTEKTLSACESWQMPENNLESNALFEGEEVYFVKDDTTRLYTYSTLKGKYLKWELIVDKPIIAVTDHTNGGQQLIVPMLKYDDRLYMMEEYMSNDGDYGTVDGGTVVKTVPLTEIPAENCTSNFLPEGTVLKVAEDGSFINCHDYSNMYVMKPVN